MTARGRGAAALGIVVIGRNEGDRLRRCLDSVAGRGRASVYVDSGSSDASVALARSRGIDVVELDPASPFTAARARNAGFARLLELAPDLEFVQFIDGDCMLDPGWLDAALAAICSDVGVAVVCGRRRELYRERTIYNRLCDMEWNTVPGSTESCGGDSLMRVEALRRAGGFDATLICGEEPDLCRRLRRASFSVRRIEAEMTLHDADIRRFRQWWRRAVRAGHAFAEAWQREGLAEGTVHPRRTLSALGWGVLLPLVLIALALASWTEPVATRLALVLAFGVASYSLPFARTVVFRLRRGESRRDAALYAVFCMVAKLPESFGALRFATLHGIGRRGRLIEYKHAALPAAGPSPQERT